MFPVTLMLRRWCTLTLVIGALASGPASGQESASPRQGIRVIDGDTLEIDGRLVQLYGIDAPELGQMCDRGDDLWECGREAALYLHKLVSFGGPPVQCEPWGEPGAPGAEAATDTEVVVGICQIGPKELGLTMVHNGYAVALPDSFPEYREAEALARQATLGLWKGHFVLPWEWREGRGTEIGASDWVRKCPIKAVFGSAGEQIYYVPTDQEYAEVTVDLERGEKMLCSDEEARAAGWGRPHPPTG